jgi:hypothetical protein
MEKLRKSASDEQEDILLEVMVFWAGAALMRSYEGRLGDFARPRLTSGYDAVDGSSPGA